MNWPGLIYYHRCKSAYSEERCVNTYKEINKTELNDKVKHYFTRSSNIYNFLAIY